MDIKELYKTAEKGNVVWSYIYETKKECLPSLDELLEPCMIGKNVYSSFLDYAVRNCYGSFTQKLADDFGITDRFLEEQRLIDAVNNDKLAEYLAGKDKENRPCLEQLMQHSVTREYLGIFDKLSDEAIIDVLKVLEVDENKLLQLQNKQIDANSIYNISALVDIADKILETPQSLDNYKKRKIIKKPFLYRDNGIAPMWASPTMLNHGIFDAYKKDVFNINLNNNSIFINSPKFKSNHLNFLHKFIKENNFSKIFLFIEDKDYENIDKLKQMNELIDKNDSFKSIEISSKNQKSFDFNPAIMKQQNLEALRTNGIDIKFSKNNELSKLKTVIITYENGNEQEIYDFLMDNKPKMLHEFTYVKDTFLCSCFDSNQAYNLMTKYPDFVIEYIDYENNTDEKFAEELSALYKRNKKIIALLDSDERDFAKMKYAISNKFLNEFMSVFDMAKHYDYDDFMQARQHEKQSLFSRMKEYYGDDFISEFEKTAEFLGFKDQLGVEFKIIDEAKKGNIIECLQGIDEDKRPSFANLVDKQSIFNFEKNVFEQIYDNNPHTFARKANQILDLYDIKLEDLKAMKANDADNHILPNLINVKTQANAMARRKQQIGLRNLKAQNNGKE